VPPSEASGAIREGDPIADFALPSGMGHVMRWARDWIVRCAESRLAPAAPLLASLGMVAAHAGKDALDDQVKKAVVDRLP
jgi:hypothetical protein